MAFAVLQDNDVSKLSGPQCPTACPCWDSIPSVTAPWPCLWEHLEGKPSGSHLWAGAPSPAPEHLEDIPGLLESRGLVLFLSLKMATFNSCKKHDHFLPFQKEENSSSQTQTKCTSGTRVEDVSPSQG